MRWGAPGNTMCCAQSLPVSGRASKQWRRCCSHTRLHLPCLGPCGAYPQLHQRMRQALGRSTRNIPRIPPCEAWPRCLLPLQGIEQREYEVHASLEALRACKTGAEASRLLFPSALLAGLRAQGEAHKTIRQWLGDIQADPKNHLDVCCKDIDFLYSNVRTHSLCGGVSPLLPGERLEPREYTGDA